MREWRGAGLPLGAGMGLLLSLALATVGKFMVAKLQWLTLLSLGQLSQGGGKKERRFVFGLSRLSADHESWCDG